MDVKLKVLGGAKAGLEISLKKEEFTIGRSSECSLRAGSDAISRKHCVIRLNKSTIKIADLNSRNGTYVNGERIEQEVTLTSGDEVRVGPLRFVVLAQHGIDTSTRPHVQGVAEAAERSAGKAQESDSLEENIDQWLISLPSHTPATRDTTSLRLDETQGGHVPAVQEQPAEDVGTVLEEAGSGPGTTTETEESVSGVHKRKDKKEPGKLPPRPKGPTTKDSREAAAEVLRAMTRRR
jgi:pSer/pThr/pTyr-binding forkhead associated (FHA) protein